MVLLVSKHCDERLRSSARAECASFAHELRLCLRVYCRSIYDGILSWIDKLKEMLFEVEEVHIVNRTELNTTLNVIDLVSFRKPACT
jgi:hypothetical protein